MKTCENCGSRVYTLGCTWCDETNYIEEQIERTDIVDAEERQNEGA